MTICILHIIMVKNGYICPRCNYDSEKKQGMERHFQRKTLCADRNNLALTPEIIDVVLKNRQYHPPKQPAKVVNNNIINYNIINNLICQMDSGEKLMHLLNYQQKQIEDLEDGLEKRFQHRVDRLENNKYKGGCYLTLDDLLELVNDVTKIDTNNIEQFNVLFDKAVKRLRLYRGKGWESFLEDVGARELVSLIKSYYLDTYEIYLIKNLHTDHPIGLNRIKLLEHLEIYYRFISIFDLSPHVDNFTDEEILGHRLMGGNENYLAERYIDVYGQQKREVKTAEKNQVKRKIINIVKENTIHNLTELNQTLMNILKVDNIFRDELLRSKEIAVAPQI